MSIILAAGAARMKLEAENYEARISELEAHITALEAQLAEAKAERDEYYARGFGLRSHVVRYLNEEASKETLREAFMRWESASGTRFSISPAALEATPAPKVTEAMVERAFRDGVRYGTICEVTDIDDAWRTSSVRAALKAAMEVGRHE